MKKTLHKIVSFMCLPLVLAACGGGSGSGSGNSTSTNSVSSPIGSLGGQLTTPDGIASITIPSGALDNTTTVTIEENLGSLAQGGLSSAYEFKPDGLIFNTPVTIRLNYNPEIIPPNISEVDLKIAFLSGGSWQSVDNSSVDTINKVISASVAHFSTYSIATNARPYGDLLGIFKSVNVYSNGDPANYPVPPSDIYNIVDNTNTGMMWQCVEYVNRYYKVTYNLDIRNPAGDAKTYYYNASARGLLFSPNNGSDPPEVGDIIVSEGGDHGHVAIVREVNEDNVTVVQQNYLNNYGDLVFPLSRTGNNIGSFGGGRTYSIKGWLRVPFVLVQTQVATSVTTSGAILNGSVSPMSLTSTVFFEWGTSPGLSSPYTTPTQNIGAGTSGITVKATLAGLSPGTTYYYRVVNRNSLGTFRGNTLNVVTANPLSVPTVQTLSASSITASGVVLSGNVNPNGFYSTAWFEWGTSPTLVTYGTTPTQIIGLGSTSVSANATMTGLTQGTPYYFRIAASSSQGTSKGAIQNFSTALASASKWTKTYGGASYEEAYAVRQTLDGGYIIAGRRSSGNFEAYLVKTDSSGNELWSNTYWAGSPDHEAYDVRQTSDGGYVIAGVAFTFQSPDSQDVYLVKTDTSGNVLWSKTFGGAGFDRASAVQQVSDGGYIITGVTHSLGANWADVYLIKTDSSGNELWSKTYGGAGYDEARAVQQTSDGGYIISGVFNQASASKAYLIKTDSNGNELWAKTYGGDEARAVQQTSDGGYVIAGTTTSSGGGDMLLVKTDSSGNELWSKTYGGTSFEDAAAVQQTSDGGYIIAGVSMSNEANGDMYLVKTDSSGNKLWSKIFGGAQSDYGYAVQQTADGGYVVAGLTISYGVNGDMYLVKTDSNGNTQ